MGWAYDPKKDNEEKQDNGKIVAGRYWFKVERAKEKTFQKSGNQGMVLTLSVAVSAERNVPVFYNIVYLDQCRFKLKEICLALGLDYDNPPTNGWEEGHFEGKSGWGKFAPNKDGYLEANKLEPAKANNGPDSRTQQPIKNEPAKNDELPF